MSRAANASAELLQRAIAGDHRAFEQLVTPHLASVRRIAFAFSRHRDAADEIAQEALLKAYRFMHTFEGSRVQPWLYSVTRSVCHDWYRRQKARGQGLEVQFDEEQDPSSVADADDLLTARTDGERLWAAIRSLDPKFRVPLILFEMEGQSYEAVARIEGVPVGTIRSRLSRARQQLLAKLSSASMPPDAGTFSEGVASTSVRAIK